MASQFCCRCLYPIRSIQFAPQLAREEKGKSNVSCCSQLIFVMLSISPGMWLQRDFFIDFADDNLESQVDVGGVVYAGDQKIIAYTSGAKNVYCSANSNSVQLR